ncbi:uncharacterized protein LOC117646046 isoform X2 [Thrips palmi]|uniref:Uncharacterized protein LOC117646046 isoform X2 n=1 Tax=Thrips palmi TaxID=161013 RepID=A0A6P8YY52_THRPL|nr:uncharacterized protein LOC117646046 isoform X2 [Thrips palmi]
MFPHGAAAAPSGRVVVNRILRRDNFGRWILVDNFLPVSKQHASHPNRGEATVQEETMEPQPAAAATPPAQRECIQELDLKDLCEATPEERREEKAATLQRLRQRGVRRLTNVWCERDPDWVLAVLRGAAPTLEEISVWNPDDAHLGVVHAMPELRRMWLESSEAPNAPPAVLPALQRGGLKWLRVGALAGPSLVSLLQTHSATLEVLWLQGNREDLPDLLRQSGLRGARIILWDFIHYPLRWHSMYRCREWLSPLQRTLPEAVVECQTCGKVPWERF